MKQKSLVLSFEEEEFIKIKKQLFAYNMGVHEFVCEVFHYLSIEDPNALALIEKAKNRSINKVFNSDIELNKENIKKFSKEMLYDIIENNMKKKNNK